MKKKIVLILLTIISSINFTNAQWQQTVLNAGDVHCLAVNGMYVFTGTNGGVFTSFDNGGSWVGADNGLGLESTIVSSFVPSGANIYASAGGVYLSANNGATWTGISGLGTITSLFISGSNIFAIAGNDLYLSTNACASWSLVDNGLSGGAITSLAIMGTNFFAGSDGGGAFLSSDTGASWTPVNNGLNDTRVKSLAVSGTYIFAGTTDGVYLSTDTGASWAAVNNGLPDTAHVFSFVESGTNIFAGVSDEGVYLSTDSGTSWTSFNEDFTDSSVVTSLTVNGTYIFAGTNGGGVWRRSLSDILAVENISAANNVISVYPNPVTNQLSIHTSSFHDGAVTVSVMNVLGQEALSYSLSFGESRGEAIDVSKLSAGMYFLQMKGESGSVVKKFVKE